MGVSPTTTKFDGSATPRAHTYLYAWSSDNQDSVDDDEYGEREGEEFAEDRGSSYQRRSGGGEWYIDKYGRRSRRADASQSYIHRGSQDAGSIGVVYKSTPNTPKHVTPKAGRSKIDLSLGDEDEDEGTGGSENQSQNHDEVVEEDGVGGGVSTKKKEKKKKKAKKRKLPVTAPIPMSATLSHSRSVPNLRAEAMDTTDDGEVEFDSSGADLPGSTGKPSVSSSSPSKSKKRKDKEKAVIDSFVFRGNQPSNTTGAWPIGEGGFVQDKRSRLIALARHLQTLFPEEQESLRKVIGKLGGLSLEAAAEKKKKKKKGGKVLLDDCSLEYSSLADSDLYRAEFGEEDPDPRGDAPGKKDTLVHVFIDQYVFPLVMCHDMY